MTVVFVVVGDSEAGSEGPGPESTKLSLHFAVVTSCCCVDRSLDSSSNRRSSSALIL